MASAGLSWERRVVRCAAGSGLPARAAADALLHGLAYAGRWRHPSSSRKMAPALGDFPELRVRRGDCHWLQDYPYARVPDGWCSVPKGDEPGARVHVRLTSSPVDDPGLPSPVVFRTPCLAACTRPRRTTGWPGAVRDGVRAAGLRRRNGLRGSDRRDGERESGATGLEPVRGGSRRRRAAVPGGDVSSPTGMGAGTARWWTMCCWRPCRGNERLVAAAGCSLAALWRLRHRRRTHGARVLRLA
jgi:hypothetical protein